MNKKQMIFVAAIAAVPAGGLLVALILGLLQGMLSDTATVSVALWIVWILAALGCLIVAFLPFAIAFYSGLLPEPAMAAAGSISDSAAADSSAGISNRQTGADDADDEGEQEFEDATADEGEQLFDDGAIDDFDDDFGSTFEDEEKAKPKKRK